MGGGGGDLVGALRPDVRHHTEPSQLAVVRALEQAVIQADADICGKVHPSAAGRDQLRMNVGVSLGIQLGTLTC